MVLCNARQGQARQPSAPASDVSTQCVVCAVLHLTAVVFQDCGCHLVMIHLAPGQDPAHQIMTEGQM